MKQIPKIILILLVLFSCIKDNDSLPNFYSFDGEIGAFDNSALVTNDGNLVICGNANKASSILIIKISMTGHLIWRKEYSIAVDSRANSLAEINGELFICGYTSPGFSPKKALLMKFSDNGDTLWTKKYGPAKYNQAYQMIKTSDNKILMCCLSSINDADDVIYLIKTDSNGDTLWTRKYAGTDRVFPAHLLETFNGEYLVTGTFEDDKSQRELYFLKLNQNGDILWNKIIGPGYRWGASTIELSNGDLVTCGRQYDPFSTSKIMLIKTDNIGNKIWENEFGLDINNDEPASIKLNSDGTYSILGYYSSPENPQSGSILIKADQQGNQLWFKTFGIPSEEEWAVNLIKDANDDNIITGTRWRFNNDNLEYRYIFMTRLDRNGNYK